MEMRYYGLQKQLTIMDIGPFIEHLLNLENMSQKEFSEKTGIEEPTLTKIKNGQSSGRRQWGKIAKYLGINVNQLKDKVSKYNDQFQKPEVMEPKEEQLRKENDLLRRELNEVYKKYIELMEGKKPGRTGTGS